ncbi:MAG TPA: hypothetical protein VF405_07940, partial [Gammaproteobacteria bacterium]
MGFEATGSAVRTSALAIALAALAACTTHVPLSDGYRGPDAWPAAELEGYAEQVTSPLEIEGDVETRTRAHFVVRQLSLPSPADSAQTIEFEYYDPDGDARTP